MNQMLAVATAAGFAGAATADFGVNLVRNHSFEAFTAQQGGDVFVEDDDRRFALDDWSTNGRLELDRYDGQYPPTTGTPVGAGDYYLFGRYTGFSSISQSIDLSFAASVIDAGHATFTLSAYLGSFKFAGGRHEPLNQFQSDIATLRVRFFDASAHELMSRDITGPDFPTDHGAPDVTGNFQVFMSAAELIPAGARSSSVEVDLRRDDDAFSDAFNNANVDLVDFAVIPAPPLLAALAAGLLPRRRHLAR